MPGGPPPPSMIPGGPAKSHEPERLVCEVNKAGRLLEYGLDPITGFSDTRSLGIQTEGLSSPTAAQAVLALAFKDDESLRPLLDVGAEARSRAGPGQNNATPTAQVLRLAVGLLGLEVHEAPNSWAETWLTFRDRAVKLGLHSQGAGGDLAGAAEGEDIVGLAAGEPDDVDEHRERQFGWQMRVLKHLRNESVPGTTADAESDNTMPEGTANFQEQLDIAEFVLHRVAHAVGVLSDPEQKGRPLVLREYTEEMVVEICRDLRQWLEQLSIVLSLYHINILDLKRENSRLADLAEANRNKYTEGEAERKAAILQHKCLQEQWKEERMRHRAEVLLGLKNCGEDQKIYSQKDMEEMQQEWEKEYVEPLQQDILDLRMQRDEARAKLQALKENKGRRPAAEEGGVSKSEMRTLVAVINGIAERVSDRKLSQAVTSLAEALQNSEPISDILKVVSKLPFPDEEDVMTRRMTNPGLAGMLTGCLEAVSAELQEFEGRLTTSTCLPSGATMPIGALAGWARKSLSAAQNALVSEADDSRQNCFWEPAPKWDSGWLERKSSGAKNAGVQTVEGTMETEGTADFEADKRRLRDALQAQLLAAQREAEAQRLRAEDALRRLAEESAAADRMIADLRAKIEEMERILKQQGLGRQAADAIWQSGLSDFLEGRDVFERLYRDALNRMRRMAEAQAQLFYETSSQFLNTVYEGAEQVLSMETFQDVPNQNVPVQPGPQVRPVSVDPSGALNNVTRGSSHLGVASMGNLASGSRQLSPLQVQRLWPPGVEDRGPPQRRTPSPDLRPAGLRLGSPNRYGRDREEDLLVVPARSGSRQKVPVPMNLPRLQVSGSSPRSREASPGGGRPENADSSASRTTAAAVDGCERRPRLRSPPQQSAAIRRGEAFDAPMIAIKKLGTLRPTGSLLLPPEGVEKRSGPAAALMGSRSLIQAQQGSLLLPAELGSGSLLQNQKRHLVTQAGTMPVNGHMSQQFGTGDGRPTTSPLELVNRKMAPPTRPALRSAGNASMPNLRGTTRGPPGPPRLLVQSVSAAY